MTLKEAIIAVLTQAGTSLHCRVITQRVLETGLWQTTGATPEATVSARLSQEVKQLGTHSRFRRTAPGVYGLSAWEQLGSDLTAHEGEPDEPIPQADTGQHSSKMSFTDAAELVLGESSDHQPMHYRQLMSLIMERGLVQTKGQTPEASLYAQVLTETKRKAKQGESPRFVMHGKGYIGLAKWLGVGLAFQIEQHNAEVRHKLHRRLLNTAPAMFESLIGQLLIALGFEDVEVTPRWGDGGIDVRGTLVVGEVIRTRMAVQVKRWKHNVQAPIVQQVRGSLGTHEQGLIITTSDFSKGACDEAARSNAVPVALMNGEQLVRLLVENDLGIERTSYDLIDLHENDDNTLH